MHKGVVNQDKYRKIVIKMKWTEREYHVYNKKII